MNKLTCLILVLSAALMGGCNHAETEASLPATPNFASDREKIQNDSNMSPMAKQAALQNLDRMEAQAKK